MVDFPGRAMVVGEAPNARAHALGRTSRVRGPEIEPGNAKMLPMVKLLRRKRKVFESAQKVFVAPDAGAGARMGFGHIGLVLEKRDSNFF